MRRHRELFTCAIWRQWKENYTHCLRASNENRYSGHCHHFLHRAQNRKSTSSNEETHLIVCLWHGNRRRRDKGAGRRTICIFENQRRCLLSLLLSGDLDIAALHDCLLLTLLIQLVGSHWRERDRTILHRSTRECDTIVVHCHDRWSLRVVVCRIH